MERTVPSATSEEIQLYRSTIYSLLRSTTEVQIRTLEEIHAGMNSLLHPGARGAAPDISAFIYSALRLPDCISSVQSIILGQDGDVFRRHGYPGIEAWQVVNARARRRRCFFDGKSTLACFIASRSDIEDVIPALTAFQIEWNKMHLLIQQWPDDQDLDTALANPDEWAKLSDILCLPSEDLHRLRTIWGAQFIGTLKQIRDGKRSMGVRLLSSSLSQYMRATHTWFENIEQAFPGFSQHPIYFVSSNTHSLANLVTGFALERQQELENFVQHSGDPELRAEMENIQQGKVRSSKENFLYYILKKYQSTQAGFHLLQTQMEAENECGITRAGNAHSFEVEAQVIDLSQIDDQKLDPRLSGGLDLSFLKNSSALVLNIDYPLGLAAYHILSKVAEQAADIRGVYIMGKAASLNATRGDIILPNVVQDEHSHNTYLFENCFSAADVAPYLNYGTVLDNQKAICVLGTFLQNFHIMDVFYREGYADIEMELGNFCSAIYEAVRPKRYPINEIVNLYNIPVDFGVLHYVSDTPMSKGKNLGAGTLSYYGMDSTYAASVAILKRIFALEKERMEP
jgi:hypothetical protein